MKSWLLASLVALGSWIGSSTLALEETANVASASPQMLNESVCVEKTTLYHRTGVIRKCKLKEPTTIQHYPCERWVRFYENGVLEQFELAEAFVVQNMTIPPHSTVFLNRDGVLQKVWFSNTMTIQGIPCKGARIGKVTTAFHDNGALQWCFLAKPHTIHGIPCKSSPMDMVGFHPNGRLKTCTLEQPITLHGQAYTRGMKVYFDESGTILPAL